MNFEFILNGKTYAIHTEVGNGTAKVQVAESQPSEDAGLEPAGE